MKYQLTVNDLSNALINVKSEGVDSILIQIDGVDYPVQNAMIVPHRHHSNFTIFAGGTKTLLSVNDLSKACRNAKNEGVDLLVIQLNDVDYPVANAIIVPHRYSSDLVLFV